MKKCPQCAEKCQDDAKVCKHCGNAFTQAETASAKRRTSLIALITAGVLMFGVYSCSTATKESETAAAVAKPEMAVTAVELYKAYEANEAAAKAKYSGSTLVVSGVVDGVMLDLFDKPIVKLVTPNQFLSAQASLKPESHDRSQSLQKGQKIELRCEGVGEVIGAPMLNGCVIL